jgi:hypothetical protein
MPETLRAISSTTSVNHPPAIEKMRTLRKRATVAIVLVVIVLATFVKLHFIRDEGGGGYFLWKDDQAFLFMGDSPIGYRMSVLEYLVEPILEFFNGGALSADDTSTLTVIQIMPAGVERSEQEPSAPMVGFYDITPVDDHIYAQCTGGICVLSGMKFQLLSEQDAQKVEGSLSRKDFEKNASGWSRRSLVGAHVGEKTTSYEFSISLSNGGRLLVRGGNPVSVDLLRQNHAPERVWYHEQRTRRVTKSQYDRVFHRQ